MRGLTSKFFAKGCNIVRLNLRNGGGSQKLSKNLGHAGQSGDIQLVLNELIQTDKLPKIGVVAFSFSANLCLKAIAEWGESVPKQIMAIACISP